MRRPAGYDRAVGAADGLQASLGATLACALA